MGEKLIKVLEVIISKLYQNEKEESDFPVIYIRDLDIQGVGMNFHSFNTTLAELAPLEVFEFRYSSEPVDHENEMQLIEHGEITPRQLEEPDLRFELWVLGNPWKIYRELSNGVPLKEISTKELEYDIENSVLSVRGLTIPVSRRQNKPVHHFILKHIFENGTENEYSYAELRNEGVYDSDVEASTYINACKNLNKAVQKHTEDKISAFLDFGSTENGAIKVNPKYLN